ncbi:MAG: beta-propeller domain-containing protein [Pseudomonadota bacterium]
MQSTSLQRPISAWSLAGLALLLVAPALAQDAFTPHATLKPFAGKAELLAYFEPFTMEYRRREEMRRLQLEEQRRRQEAARRTWEEANPGKTWMPTPPAPPMPAAMSMAAPAAAAAESITNSQSAGVDEGGIVKLHGRHLVILRRGRLSTVNVDRHALAPVASIPAYGPNVPPGGAWYDEMLVSGNTVAVIGYSYARGGTELGLFNIDDKGGLSYRATYHLKSSDYYSSRNYASRLVGTRLVMYAPIPINVTHADPLARLPTLRQWQGSHSGGEFRPIAPPTRIYRTDEALKADDYGVTLHSVTTCDLAQPELRCESSGVLGKPGRVFYASEKAIYVWAMHGLANASALFRLPLDGSAPSALKTQGSPIDQFSFLEQPDGKLNVLVHAGGAGDAMWRGEKPGGNLSLLRVTVRDFGDGQASAPASAYSPLPSAGGDSLQNRYVGNKLLYGTGAGWYRPGQQVRSTLQVVDLKDATTHALPLPHGVDRIDALGQDAIAIGSDGSALHFSSVQLAGKQPKLVNAYVRPNASQGETRSHGFFYKPDAPAGGLVGLPIRGGGQGGYRQLWDEPAAMLYLRNDKLRLSEVGSLPARPGIGRNDGCQASCTDWYGNARPVFLGGRIFALMGYELVEGRELQQADNTRRLVELRRVSFAPGSADYQP